MKKYFISISLLSVIASTFLTSCSIFKKKEKCATCPSFDHDKKKRKH